MGNVKTTQHFETLAIHGGTPPDPTTGASSPAIHQSSSFVFKSTGHAADVFALKEPGFIYSRVNNPTVATLETKLALLEGGVGATCTSSGLATNLLAFSALMTPGDEFIATTKLYGGTAGSFAIHSNAALAGNACSPTRPTPKISSAKSPTGHGCCLSKACPTRKALFPISKPLQKSPMRPGFH